ncbi:hypothetical protein JKF63_01094 [Porcisia hertigi]|uniref:Uncharacterized protein n=1 Tax=Porcisia hertigi TaxID=2761500 RepID=A0A836KZ45_9TRYP|nr:hypothetical protein JKF63_01094 [Porcisia hertigi]
MLHIYNKIQDAIAACTSLQFPLIVGVHGKLPNVVNNADEATCDRGTDVVVKRTSAVRQTFSFLPALHSTDRIEPNGSPDADMANSSLGYLLRPANLTETDARNASVMAQALADGEELVLVPDFPLGSVQGGAAQREALLVTLLEGRLSPVTVLHLIEEGSPDYAAFSAAFSATASVSGAPLLRVHIFYPQSPGITPVELSGDTLTPQLLHNCVHMGLLGAQGGLAGAGASGATDEILSFFSTTVSAMNRESVRTRQQTSLVSLASALATAPSNQQQHNDPAVTTVPIVAVPAQHAKGLSDANALNTAHLIRIAGLPMSFSTTTTTNAAHKTILTTPSMTFQTVWRTVEKHLEWAQREMQQAQAASTWNGVTPPKPGTRFTFTIEPSATSTDVVVTTVTTCEEASRVRLQDYPRNTVVQVHFDSGALPPPPPAPAVQTTRPTAEATSTSRPTEYVCEGNVCRRRTPGDAQLPASTATAPLQQRAESAPAPLPAKTSAAAPVRLRCSLPNGKTLDLPGLDPAVATLRANVRPAVADALGYDKFVFVCAYPPRRYSPETDEPLPLEEVGLGQSCALRVVSLDGPVSNNAPSRGAESQQQPGHTRQLLFNAASSLMGMFSGARGNQGDSRGAAAAVASSSPDSRQPRRQRRAYNSMAEILVANEEAERQTAMERLRQEQQRPGPSSSSYHTPDAENRAQGKKSNRYFGGGSTEFIAEDGSDEAANHSEVKRTSPESLTATQQEAFLCEQLRHLMNRYRQQSGEAGDNNEEDAGEGDEESAQERAGGYNAFQGQGRRLTDDTPPASGNSADTAPPPHPPSATESAPGAATESQ